MGKLLHSRRICSNLESSRSRAALLAEAEAEPVKVRGTAHDELTLLALALAVRPLTLGGTQPGRYPALAGRQIEPATGATVTAGVTDAATGGAYDGVIGGVTAPAPRRMRGTKRVSDSPKMDQLRAQVVRPLRVVALVEAEVLHCYFQRAIFIPIGGMDAIPVRLSDLLSRNSHVRRYAQTA
jgi:hypothetical protein